MTESVKGKTLSLIVCTQKKCAPGENDNIKHYHFVCAIFPPFSEGDTGESLKIRQFT